MKNNNETRCPACDVAPGEHHCAGCDVEPCPYCGHQLLTCDHYGFGIEDLADADRLPWTGAWPGVSECRTFGWYARLGSRGWEPCAPDASGSLEDLNRLLGEAVWDRHAQCWRQGFVHSTSRFDLAVYCVPENSPRMYVYRIDWKRSPASQHPAESYATQDEAHEAAFQHVQDRLNWTRQKLRRFIEVEQALAALGGRVI